MDNMYIGSSWNLNDRNTYIERNVSIDHNLANCSSSINKMTHFGNSSRPK